MRLAASEIIERGAKAYGRYDAKVDLEAGPENHRGAGWSLCLDTRDVGKRDKAVHDPTIRFGRSHKIEIAHGFAGAAQAACRGGVPHAGYAREKRDQSVCLWHRECELGARGHLGVPVQRLKDVALGLLPQTRKARRRPSLAAR